MSGCIDRYTKLEHDVHNSGIGIFKLWSLYFPEHLLE